MNCMNCLPVRGYEGLYEVDTLGRVFSLDREVLGSDGTVYPFKGRRKAETVNPRTGYKTMVLYKQNVGETKTLHRIVCEAFHPNLGGKSQVNHKDGDKLNCHPANLEWVTQSENAIHAVATGLRVYPQRMTESDWLFAIQEVIQGNTLQSVAVRSPYKLPFFSTKIRKIAVKHGLLHMLNDAILENRRQQARKNGSKNN